ncbi:MAG: DNA-processing protein DprA [Alphaproteobacteria bacterium]|nr:DNA-processing protein DprA [Alphaproteobacteria bacterium]
MDLKEEILDYIQLINTENIGPKKFLQFVNEFGSAKQALQNLPPRYKAADRKFAVQEMSLANHLGIKILISTMPEYPQALLNIPDYPPVLYALGHYEILNMPSVCAIVGSRNASVNGRKLASKLAYELTNQNILVVSGMARGIDTSAHKGALYAQEQTGPTVAVLGTGIDIAYPAENTDLYQQIAQNGCLISEFSIGTKPQANNFPRRNRIISGLSNGIVVIEANSHSGSLITAYTAAEQGREVMAIPGSPLDGRSGGTNKLIKEGAALVENAEDIIAILQNSHISKPQFQPVRAQKDNDLFTTPLDNKTKIDNIPEQKNSTAGIINYVTPEGVDIDEIIEATGLDSATVNAELLYLEIDGRISRQSGNKVALIK